MAETLRLLCIEDVASDAALLELHLRKHGIAALCHRVETAAQLEAALVETWDVVLSDYNLPGMDFLASLRLIQARQPLLPVILVTGALGEETAVELLKQGAGDFVLKNNLTRLVPAIQRCRVLAEGQRAQLEAEREQQRLNRTLKAFSASGWALVHATDEADYLREFCRIVVEDCGHAMTWVGYAENDAERSIRPVAHAGADDGYLATLRLSWGDGERGRGPTGSAIRLWQPVICHNMRTDPAFLPWREQALRRGYASSIALPLQDESRAFGALTIYSCLPAPFGAEEVSMLQKLADELAYGIGVLRLRTERAAKDAALRESEAKFRSAFANAAIGFAMTTPEGRFVDANPAYCRLIGYSVEELENLAFPQLIHPEDHSENMRLIGAMLAGVIPDFVVENRYIHKRGHHVWVRKSVSLVRDAQGAPQWILALTEDVTERRRAEAALLEADRRKDEFLSMLSHELRNPMVPIRNAAHVLGLLDLDEPRVRWAQQIIERQVAHVTRLVDDLLDVSRIATGKITLRKTRILLADLLRQAVETVQPAMASKSHHLELRQPASVVELEGDPVRLVQVLQNLLNNAAKYTPNGGHIELEARQEGGEAVIQVCDDGIGIAPDLLPHVFDLFRQADHTLDRAQGGLGIGLTLVQRLVELHGGRVSAESAGLGLGATFSVRLPVLTGQDEASAGADSGQASAGGGLRVLVVDDEPMVAESMVVFLELEGHQVCSAATGDAALHLLRDFRPQVVLLDIGLPGQNGYEVARRIRQEATGANVKLLAVSGYGHGEAIELSQQAGFDHHLVKPIDPAKLCDILSGIAVTSL